MKKFIILSLFIFALSACAPKQAAPDSESDAMEKTSETEAMEKEGEAMEKTKPRVINISAKRWEFSPETIKVKEGETVKLVIENTDTTHGIVIPEFGAKGIDELTFTADKKGTFEFKCTTFCGKGHTDMSGTLVVE